MDPVPSRVETHGNTHRAVVAVSAAAVVLAVLVAAYFLLVFKPRERARLVAQVEQELVQSVRLRTLAIQEWRGDGLRDAELVGRLPALHRALASPSGALDVRDTEAALLAVLSTQRLRKVQILDNRLNVVLWANGLGSELDAGVIPLATRVLREGRSGMRMYRLGEEELVAFAAPLPSRDGLAVLTEAAADWLYAYLETWPILGSTSEALLVRWSLDSVLYLSPLRHDTTAPIAFRKGLNELDGAKALQVFGGADSFTSYSDYRGEPVYAAATSLDSGTLGLVVKRDQAEVEAELHDRVFQAASLGGLILAAGFSLAILITLAIGQVDLRAAVRERTRELEYANQYLETVQMVVSHDLRGPLQAMLGYSELLEEEYAGALGPNGSELIGGVRSGVSSMNRMLMDLMDLGRARRVALTPTPVEMEALVGEVVAELTPEFQWTGTLECGPLPPAMGDPLLLRQVWVNLIGNAMKFAGPAVDARIEVSGWRDADRVFYSVRDHGPGFSPEDASQIFEPYTRGGGRTKAAGFGLGLAIVKQVVERHGGRVWAEAPSDGGALFVVALPHPKGGPQA